MNAGPGSTIMAMPMREDGKANNGDGDAPGNSVRDVKHDVW